MTKPVRCRASGETGVSLLDAPIACCELDPDGNVVWVNHAACRLMGLPEAEILGRPAVPDAAGERVHLRPDGAAVVLEIHQQPRRGPGGEFVGMRVFLLDVTGRKRAEEALCKVREDLESRIHERTQELELAVDFLRREMDERRLAEKEHLKLEAQVQQSQHLESIGVLAGGVAHEFNNLLTSIMGYASMAGMEVPEASRARNHLEQVLSAAKSAADLTQQMLAYSGRGRFVLESIDVSDTVEQTALLLESMVSKKATLTLDLTPGLPPIEADPRQIRQVLINLANNASEALGDRGGEIVIRTRLMWAEGGELPALQAGHIVSAGFYVFLEVADTGCGMDDATRGRIFDPFFTTKFTGRGLGLPAVMGIVRAHGGSIHVASSAGEGTLVRVFFPALGDSDTPSLSGAAKPAAWPRTGTVLLVDDEEPIRRLARAILEGAGLTVLVAADGIEALDVFRRSADQIHAVVLDLTMPGMDGAEVFRHIHQLRPETRVVLCSGYNEHEVASRLGEHRPAGFLRKPYLPRELLDVLNNLW